ncbi:MAG: trimethylamine methyltransferase family protein [Thermofilaceae archaeon]
MPLTPAVRLGCVRLEVLAREDCRAIHEAAMEVLERVGVRVLDERALKLLADAGCEVNQRSSVVRIPEHLVMGMVCKAPRSFTLYGRGSKLVIEEGRTHFSSQGTAVFVIDPLTGERRPSTLSDVERFYRLTDALENVHHATLVVHPSDVPERAAHAYSLLAAFRNTVKTVDAYARSGREALDCIRMAAIVAGGLEELRRRPMLLFFYNPVSPLQHSRELLEGLEVFAEHGQPIIVAPECQAGATAPATLAGLLVQQNAEILSAITIAELVNPGTPVLYGTVSTIMDMRTGNIALGAVEAGLINAATAQLARFYGLPSRGTGGTTDSKLPDLQAGFEKAVTLVFAALSGINFVYDSAGSLDSTLAASLEQLVIDDELCGIAARAARGIEVNEETLALNVIEEVGPGGIFLSKLHTVRNVRREHYVPKLLSRVRWERWRKSKSLVEEARLRAEELLKQHVVEPLDKEIERLLGEYVKQVLNRQR